MQELADELVESWTNGNRTDVIAEIVRPWKTSARAALLSALIFSQLNTDDRTVFLRMMKEAL